ncbi:MAG: redoxin domain-containing protein [Chloroflexi bacterium]|nr:redoxin domain-containing protein [Chloroflexota bacterium]
MPSLESQLAKMREASAKQFPPLIELNRRMVADLESSVIADALDIGDEAPEFELADAATDAKVKLSAILAEGPVVLAFYRGHW